MKKLLNISVLSSLLLSIFATLDINCMHRRIFKKSYQRQNHMSRKRGPKKVKPRVRKKVSTREKNYQNGQQYTSARDRILQKIKDAHRQRRNRMRLKRYIIKRAKQVLLSQATDKVMKIIMHACKGRNGLTQKFGVRPQDLLTDFIHWLKCKTKKRTENIISQRSSGTFGLLRLLIFFITMQRSLSYTFYSKTGPLLYNEGEIFCRTSDNKRISCSKHSPTMDLMKDAYIDLEGPFNNVQFKEEEGACKAFWNLEDNMENMNMWWEFIKNHKIPVCSYNKEINEVECDFSQSKKINVEEILKINFRDGKNFNQRLYEKAIEKETIRIGMAPNLCATNVTKGEQQLTQEEVAELFPSYKKMCEDGRVWYCPKISLSYFPIKHTCAKFYHLQACWDNDEECHKHSHISIPYIEPNNIKVLQKKCISEPKLLIPHELGHQKHFERDPIFGIYNHYTDTLDCTKEFWKLEKQLGRTIEKNEELSADFWGALTSILSTRSTKEVFRLAVGWMKEWLEKPHDYYFEITRVLTKSETVEDEKKGLIGTKFHCSSKLRAAALVELATKMDAMLDYLNS